MSKTAIASQPEPKNSDLYYFPRQEQARQGSIDWLNQVNIKGQTEGLPRVVTVQESDTIYSNQVTVYKAYPSGKLTKTINVNKGFSYTEAEESTVSINDIPTEILPLLGAVKYAN
jgi:hypothetical protein